MKIIFDLLLKTASSLEWCVSFYYSFFDVVNGLCCMLVTWLIIVLYACDVVIECLDVIFPSQTLMQSEDPDMRRSV